jgi:hypothetical protein
MQPNIKFLTRILCFITLSFGLVSTSFSDPNVLQCKKNCGNYDTKNNYSFQARMAQGEDMWGANVTFIEDDIIISSAHILGFEPNKKQTLSCGPEAAKKRNTDWSQHKGNMYVVDGKNYPNKKIIIAKVLDISARSTGEPPGYDILVAHVDRNCNRCNKDITIIPIPIANNLPAINTKALHIAVPGDSAMNKGRFFDNHLLNGRIWGGKNNACSRQTLKHDGKLNPPMLFDTSGSPVIFKECGKYALHGLHGNGMDYDGHMYEFLQLIQTQKKWIQSEIYRWTGRTEMIDSCSSNGKRSFMPSSDFDAPQNDCVKETFQDHPANFPTCRLTPQNNAVAMPW